MSWPSIKKLFARGASHSPECDAVAKVILIDQLNAGGCFYQLDGIQAEDRDVLDLCRADGCCC